MPTDTVVVQTDPAPETESTERTLGRLEAETENLSDEVTEMAEEVETLEAETDQARTIAETASQNAWDAKMELDRLREEMTAQLAEIRTEVANLLSEAEADLESEIEEIEIPPIEQAEPIDQPKTKSLAAKILGL